MLVSGSYEPPGQFVPPPADASDNVASGPSALLTTGGVKIGPYLYLRDHLHPLGAQLRREVDQIVDDESLRVVVERLAASVQRKRLRRRVVLAGHIAFRHRPFFDRPQRLSRHAIEDVHERLLGRLRDRLDDFSVSPDVDEDRRARNVVIPDAVVHELVVPLALAGLQIDGDEAFGEQVVAGPIGAEVIAGRALDRQIRDLQLGVDADLSPRAGVAGVRPRVFQPRLVAELAGLRNRVEDPQALAGAHVESADVALHVRLAGRHAARSVRGADDDDVAGDRRRGVKPDLARHRIDLLIVVLFQVDDAVNAEARNAHAGLRVQRDELIARRDVEDPFLFAVGPVREAAPRQLAWRRGRRADLRARCASRAPRRFRDRARRRLDGCPRSNTARRSPSPASTRT